MRLREQAAVAAQPSGENEDQYASFSNDDGALCHRSRASCDAQKVGWCRRHARGHGVTDARAATLCSIALDGACFAYRTVEPVVQTTKL